MNKIKKFGLAGLAALVLGFGLANSSDAKTVKVPSQYSTIQKASDVCAAGDTVLVAPGIYDESVTIGDISLISESGPKNTIINYTGNNSVIKVNGTINHTTTIDGFTIQGANSDSNTGINLGGPGARKVYIKNNIIQNNFTGIGRDWNSYANNLDIFVDHNIICNNSHAGFQMTYTINGVNSVTFNEIRDNPRFGIETVEFLGIYDIDNNTFAKNMCGVYLDPNHGTYSSKMNHNIFAYNTFDYSGAQVQNETCNLFFQNENPGLGTRWQDPDDMFVNPYFCNPSNNDYTLNTNSPVVKYTCWPVGALGTGCSFSPAKPMTWGKLKNVYK